MRQFVLGLLCLCYSIAVNATPVDLVALQIQPSATASKFTFVLTDKTRGKVKQYSNPARVVVDFTDTKKHFEMRNSRLGGANVTSIDAETLDNGDARFIFYVKERVKWKINVLPKDSDNAVKIILDIISLPPVEKPVPTPGKDVKKDKVAKQFHQKFKQSVLSTFETFSREISKRQQEDKEKVVAAKKEIERQVAKKQSRQPEPFTVVIDAGHGGKDSGAKGPTGKQEKDVVLAIAKYLAAKINREPGMRAVLTRGGDYYVPLRKRLALARKGDADLFVAIHADAFFNKRAHGASVYALSLRGATSEAARWLAQRDNYSELGDLDFTGLADNSPMVRSVLIDLAQTVTIRDSLLLGNRLLDKISDMSSLHHKRVEQAPFVVLKSPDIPSVLIETGFISNPREERLLASVSYQDKMATAILEGIKSYQAKQQ